MGVQDSELGTILSALGAGILFKGVQGYNRGRQVKQYANTLNANLPQGYKIPAQTGTFYFGQPSEYQTMLKGIYDNQIQQYQNNVQAQGYQQLPGMSPYSNIQDPTVLKELYSGVIAPTQKTSMDNAMKQQQAMGDEQAIYSRNAYQPPRYQAPQYQAPVQPVQPVQLPYNGGQPQYGYAPQQELPSSLAPGNPYGIEPPDYQASTTYNAPVEMPDYINQYPFSTPEALRAFNNDRIQQQSADNATGRLNLDQRKYSEIDYPRGQQDIEYKRQQIIKLKKENDWIDREKRARINQMMRSGNSGAASALVKDFSAIDSFVRSGQITAEEATTAKKVKLGLQPRASNGDQGGDAEGEPWGNAGSGTPGTPTKSKSADAYLSKWK